LEPIFIAEYAMSRQSTRESYRMPKDEIAIDPADGEAFESLFKRTIREGEKELMLAVLEDAISSFQRYLVARNEGERKQFQDAQEWILGKDEDWLFSFDAICEALDLDPDYLRRGLMAWAKRHGHSGQLAGR
jgi:predicted Ser/Thr protein kinase